MSGEPETLTEARRADRIARRSAAVRDAREGIAAYNALLADLVTGLRRDGVSWRHIGQLLGVSRQAAEQRYSRNTP